jgi:zinc protease
MIRLRAIAVLFAALAVAGCRTPAWEQPPPPTRDRPVVQPGKLHRAELDNGLELIALEDHRLPRVAMGVTVRRGEGAVAADQAGLASFTAEVMRRGAGDWNALELSRAVDALGAQLSVSADWDSMTVQVSGLSRDLDALLDILSAVILRPRMDQREADRTRKEILAALEQAKDDPGTLAGWHLASAIYGDHRYGRPSDGAPETVEKLTVRAARDFHRKVFLPNDAIFYAAGDVDMDSLLPRVGQALGAWERGEVTEPGPPPPAIVPPARKIVIVDRPDLTQARIVLGHEGLARTDPDRVAASLMNSVLAGGGFSSRLMETVRSEAGLTYSVDSGFAMRRHPGPFVVQTFTRVPEVRRVLDLTLEEIARMRKDPPHEDELKRARALAVGQFSLGLETSEAVLGALVNLDVYGLPQDSLDTYRGRVRAVTTRDTARMAREHLHPERAAIVLVGPAETLRPQVEDLGPVEVVQP